MDTPADAASIAAYYALGLECDRLGADPACFTTAYFHRPEELAAECAAAGLAHLPLVAQRP